MSLGATAAATPWAKDQVWYEMSPTWLLVLAAPIGSEPDHPSIEELERRVYWSQPTGIVAKLLAKRCAAALTIANSKEDWVWPLHLLSYCEANVATALPILIELAESDEPLELRASAALIAARTENLSTVDGQLLFDAINLQMNQLAELHRTLVSQNQQTQNAEFDWALYLLARISLFEAMGFLARSNENAAAFLIDKTLNGDNSFGPDWRFRAIIIAGPAVSELGPFLETLAANNPVDPTLGLSDLEQRIRIHLASHLVANRCDDSLACLGEYIYHEDPHVRAAAVSQTDLRVVDRDQFVRLLIQLLNDPSELVRLIALRSLIDLKASAKPAEADLRSYAASEQDRMLRTIAINLANKLASGP